MKKLLFLVGLIMVAAACTSSGSSNQNNQSQNCEEESRSCNGSFVITKDHRNGACDYAVCVADYDDEAQTLHLYLGDNSYAYGLSQISEEFHKQVKNNKVTLLLGFGDPMPAVVEKDERSYKMPPPIETDYRQFTFKCILKDKPLAFGVCQYIQIYNGMFLNGLTKIGNKTYENGQFFFGPEDLVVEIDKSKTDKGYLSAGLALYDSPHNFYRKDRAGEYKYAIVQSYCEDGMLILKIENEQIYKYPLNAIEIRLRREIANDRPVSALQLSNKKWIPVFLDEGMSGVYGMNSVLFATDKTYRLRPLNSLIHYNDFMLEVGITTSYQPIDYFFYKAKKTK